MQKDEINKILFKREFVVGENKQKTYLLLLFSEV